MTCCRTTGMCAMHLSEERGPRCEYRRWSTIDTGWVGRMHQHAVFADAGGQEHVEGFWLAFMAPRIAKVERSIGELL